MNSQFYGLLSSCSVRQRQRPEEACKHDIICNLEMKSWFLWTNLLMFKEVVNASDVFLIYVLSNEWL